MGVSDIQSFICSTSIIKTSGDFFIACETLIFFPFALFNFHLQDLTRRAPETKTTNSQKPHPSCACVFYNRRVFVVQCLSKSRFPIRHDSLDQRSSLRARCSLASKSTFSFHAETSLPHQTRTMWHVAFNKDLFISVYGFNLLFGFCLKAVL